MTDEQINIAIAEARGLFKIEPLRRTTRKGKPDPNGVVLWYCVEHYGGAATYTLVPDCCNNLNAMHEAEKILLQDSSSWHDFGLQLGKLMLGERWWFDISFTDLATASHATARQRAEAFLKTLKLWKE